MSNLLPTPFVLSSWQFPDDNPQSLSVQLDRAYIALAQGINVRDIGVYPTSGPVATGQQWAVSGGQLANGLRQIFFFTATGSILHNIAWNSVKYLTNCFGSFTDGTNWYGVQFAGTPAPGQLSFYVSSTNIVVQAGLGAPTVTSGVIVLEWIV